jgi:peptide/nickel transport system ATP-binding protein
MTLSTWTPAPSPDDATKDDLLVVKGLSVEFAGAAGWARVVDDVDFSIPAGQTLGIVGESGSGKTVSSLAIMGLLPARAARIPTGSVKFDGRELIGMPPAELRTILGNDISMIFQEPMTSLNPAFTVGNQIAEVVRCHRKANRATAWARAVEMLDLVGIPDPARRAKDYPHALSGGMRQRAMIAMALACEPKLLIADEPTTALDVTIQAQILELIRSLQKELGMSVLFVTHDLGVVAEVCDRVTVMYAGQVVEANTVENLFARPRQPYTEALLSSMPQLAKPGEALKTIPGQVPRAEEFPVSCRFAARCEYAQPECAMQPIPLDLLPDGGHVRCIRHEALELTGASEFVMASVGSAKVDKHNDDVLLDIKGLTKFFPVYSGVLRRVVGQVRAVEDVDLQIHRGETLGLVGESGSGKSTVARLILQLIEPTSGSVVFKGTELVGLKKRALRNERGAMQIVFQDPYSSLNPRAPISDAIGEPLEIHQGLRGKARNAKVVELLGHVGLGRHLVNRYPHEFSGGQRQRIAVARAIALAPDLVICDEPVSSLDVSTQSQVINLLRDLQEDFGLAFLFIAHDLSVVRHISDRIAVMYLGKIVEVGQADEVYLRPTHPYTQALLSAIPIPDPVEQRQRNRIVLEGDVPSPLHPPSGCRFHTRCSYAMDICSTVDPSAYITPVGTVVHCHLHTEGPKLAGQSVTILSERPSRPTGEPATTD